MAKILKLVVLTFTVVALAQPVQASSGAADKPAATSALSGNSAASTSTAAQGKKARATAKTKYCIEVEPETGTRMGDRLCKTRAEWEAVGVDPTNLK